MDNLHIHGTTVYGIGPEIITYRSCGSVEVVFQFLLNPALNKDMAAGVSEPLGVTCDIEVPVSMPWDVERGDVKSCHVDVGE